MPNQRVFWLFLFLTCSLGDLIAVSTQWVLLEQICKPLLMPTLLGYFYFSISRRLRKRSVSRFMQYALLLSMMGDVFLMFDKENFLFFITGLLFFLAAHLQYIRVFKKWGSPQESRKKQAVASFSSWKSAVIGGALLLYGIALYIFIFRALDDIVMKIAVLVYAGTITAMALYSLSTRHTKPRFVFFTLLAGALLFVVSDSLIAINKFLTEIPHAQLMIMLTYIFAQFFLVEGVIKGLKEGD